MMFGGPARRKNILVLKDLLSDNSSFQFGMTTFHGASSRLPEDCGGGFSMAERLVGSDLHRSQLSQAAVDSNLLTAAISHL